MSSNANGVGRFQTIKQLAASGAGFSEASIRWLVFNAKSNGLSEAIVKIGRKVLIDVDAFTKWIERHRTTDIAGARKKGRGAA